MVRRLTILMALLAGTVTMLAACYVLLFVTVRVQEIQSPLVRAGAVVATLVIGVLLLVSATYFSTHLVVRLYGKEASSDPSASLGAGQRSVSGSQ